MRIINWLFNRISKYLFVIPPVLNCNLNEENKHVLEEFYNENYENYENSYEQTYNEELGYSNKRKREDSYVEEEENLNG